MRHLVNAYEVEAGTVNLQVTLYDPYLSASEVVFHEGAISSVLTFRVQVLVVICWQYASRDVVASLMHFGDRREVL